MTTPPILPGCCDSAEGSFFLLFPEVSPMDRKSRKISLPLILAALLSGGLGIGAFVYTLLTGIGGLAGSMLRVEMPATESLALEKGNYTVFHEYSHPFPAEKQEATDSELEHFQLTVSSPEGQTLTVRHPSGNSSYDWGEHSGYSLYEFQVSTPGDYTLTGSYPEEHPGGAAMLALSHDFGKALFSLIGKCFLILGVPLLFAVLFLVMGLRGSGSSSS